VVTNRLYEVDIAHVRSTPMRYEVHHRSYQWYVDLDDLPRLPRPLRVLARFQSRDHVGDPQLSLRENLDAYLAAQGIDLHGGRITMLANARSLGYVFNPLSLFWCHDANGDLVCVVAEVHNTYRQRHRYLLRTDDAGRAEVDKQFYVSPFYPVDGYYRMSVREPDEQLAVTVTLHRPNDRPFTASVRGVAIPATTGAVLRAVLRHPLETLVIRAAITAHGLRLWRKGLPVQPRPPRPSTEEHSMPAPAAERLAALLRDTVDLDLPVRLRAWDGSTAGPSDGPTIVIRSRRALRRLLWAPGELGLARAYVTGDIDVEGDLTDGFRRVWQAARGRPTTSVRLGARGRAGAALTAARLGAIGLPPRPPASEARMTGRLHTIVRDRSAIAHHYDLSNEFYEFLLDETMAYSSAYFARDGMSLADAQRAKLDLICTKLDLQPGMRLLDVGCGWGSLVLHAAENFGVHATGITLSAQQRDFVAKRVADRGLTDRVDVRLQDYRELDDAVSSFDAVSSIEMGEHVGEDQYPTYAAILFAALRPGARLLLQQMSRHAGTAPGGGAFIESYIAPDMHMRPMSETVAHLERAGFEVRHVQAMREHYVTTVEHWIDTLEARWPEFVSLVGEEVARVWRLYLVGGASAFDEGRMGVDQFLAVRPT
jgi:cyclopropane fatty-acyl-phospholipid synthase-like methyltransferase/DUF1365 family protein